jgi:hypothetical protein
MQKLQALQLQVLLTWIQLAGVAQLDSHRFLEYRPNNRWRSSRQFAKTEQLLEPKKKVLDQKLEPSQQLLRQWQLVRWQEEGCEALLLRPIALAFSISLLTPD